MSHSQEAVLGVKADEFVAVLAGLEHRGRGCHGDSCFRKASRERETFLALGGDKRSPQGYET